MPPFSKNASATDKARKAHKSNKVHKTHKGQKAQKARKANKTTPDSRAEKTPPIDAAQKDLLRFITCGSVDDGKSTLIGRLLYEADMIFDDQMTALQSDSKKLGTQGKEIDFALLMDGLAAEREQGITIDVAYRFFATDKRKFIVADTPGHEQYTRNMATGASTAELAVLLVDARKGILTQTRRHAYIVALLGIRHIVLAINKMDLVDYERAIYENITNEFRDFAANLSVPDIQAVPVCALHGDNVITRSARMDWYQGASLLDHLENIDVATEEAAQPLRMPVQWVNRPNLDFRGFAGQLASGHAKNGDDVKILPGGKHSTIERIVTYDGDIDEAVAGQSVTLTLRDELDISRGDVITDAKNAAEISDQFEATLLWMAEQPLLPGRSYILKIGCKTVNAAIHAPKYRVNINTLEQLAARTLTLNEIGVCTLALDQPIAFDAYVKNRIMGGFILIDRISNHTVGMGMLNFALRRAANIHWQEITLDKAAHAMQKGQNPAILWFTGLSGSGKSTIANAVQQKLFAMGRHSFILDGDNIRHGLNRDLGFTDQDRVENIRRVGEVASLMVEAGLITLVAFISPFRAERRSVRERVQEGEFIEIFIDTPLHIAEQRDPKGLYQKARQGKLANFTGIDSPYETPEKPEITIDTTQYEPEAAAQLIIDELIRRGLIHS